MSRRPLARSTIATFFVLAIAMLTAAFVAFVSTIQPDVPTGAYDVAFQVKGATHYLTASQHALYLGACIVAGVAALTASIIYLRGT